MGYQVTARKWRPQTFDDVVEQRHVIRTLKNAIQLDRIAHAYLFAGTRGVGKTTTARVLAKALNCEHGPTTEPCNACRSCLGIMQGASFDIVEIDGASNRGIDEIRDLRERLHYLPSHSRYKVYIIDEVHMLTKEAFNALLKTLEEPPPHVVFIFATTELEKIPHTILSRCQRFEFKRVSLTGIAEQLDHIVQDEGISVSHTSLMRIAKAAEGSMRDAQSLLDQVVAFSGLNVQDEDVAQLLGTVGMEYLVECLTALFKQDASTALQIAHALQSEGHQTAAIVRALLEGLRHMIVLKTVKQPEALIPFSQDDLVELRSLTERVTVEEIYGHFHILTAAEQMLRLASNAFQVLEMTLVRMACIGRVQPLQAILDRLDGVQKEAIESPQAVLTPVVSHPVTDADTLPSEPSSDALNSEHSQSMPVAPGGDFWETLQESVAKRRPSLAAFLQDGRIIKRTDTELVIGFAPEDRFSCASLQEPENLLVVRETVQALLGQPLQVIIKALNDDTDPIRGGISGGMISNQNTVIPGDAQQQKRETIQAVLDVFDGRIIM
jgi:DNA polymerase-3 subunit gamma/tau